MNIVSVLNLPECDICHTPARYDMPLTQGQWANVCRACALLYTYLPMWEIKGMTPILGSEYQLVEEKSV
jgi:hypothetical protein